MAAVLDEVFAILNHTLTGESPAEWRWSKPFGVTRGTMSSKPSFFVVSFLLITLGIAGSRAAPAEQSELDHSARIAQEIGGETEYRTPDGSRVDILTKDTAWQSAIGQSLFYGMATNRQPGIILLIAEPERERRYYLRCLAVAKAHGIRLETRRIQ